jgi:rfaE bifunctional protein kinase chain/domain/rfaE bifunctional protein nucleotidyltransferase chain/domain
MSKIVSIKKIVSICEKNRKKKKRIVLCHGVFDLLHYGHILHFEEAKSQGDILVVSITSSSFVNKGPNRPYFDDEIRSKVLESMSVIDYIVVNDNYTPINLIKLIKPNIYCKGPDYKNNSDDLTKNIILEKKIIKSVKGKIFITSGKTFSSSNLINTHFKIKNEKTLKAINHIKKNFTFFNIIKEFEIFFNLKVLVVGETIIDQYNFCRAVGKSGKEPMMVFKDLNTNLFLGGSAYIARNLSSLCKKIDFLTMIGDDDKFTSFINSNLEKNIKPIFFKKKNSPTILKKRYVDDVSNSKIMGIYSYSDDQLNFKEKEHLNSIIKKFKKYDLILISDFGHGMLDQSAIDLLKKKAKYLMANAQLNAVNKGYHDLQKFDHSDCLVINESELRYELRDQNGKIESLMSELKKKLTLNKLILTRGSEGVIVLTKKNKFYYCGAFSNRVVDKVGSGDCLMSVVSMFSANDSDEYLSLVAGSLAASEAVQNFGNGKIINKNSLLKSLKHLMM